jgi:hypothetical protein
MTHYGLATKGAIALCGSTDEDPRRTAVRLVSCQYCLNVIDRVLHSVLFATECDLAVQALVPFALSLSRRKSRRKR